MRPWRLLLTPPRSGAENMALDHALLGRARATGESVLRVYAWRAPTLSFGRHQQARGEYDPLRAAALGLDIVRRPTGGRAVLHHREITYSVTARVRDGESLRESYEAINRLLLDGLRRIGVRAALASPAGRAPGPGTAPCFEEPTEGEIVLDGRKLVGSAQWRDGGALLQHGSILVEDDQPALASLLTRQGALPRPAATLRAALGRAPDTGELASALLEAVRALEDPGASELEPDSELIADAERASALYRADEWTWRR